MVFKYYWNERPLKSGSFMSGYVSISYAVGWILGRILRRIIYGPELSFISNTMLLFGVIFVVITSILLLIGVTKEYKSLLLPWMIGGAPLILSSLVAFAIDACKSTYDYFFNYVWAPFFLLYFSYHILITVSFYCELKAKQNEQINDLESPPPEKEKEVKVQATTSSLEQIDAVD